MSFEYKISAGTLSMPRLQVSIAMSLTVVTVFFGVIGNYVIIMNAKLLIVDHVQNGIFPIDIYIGHDFLSPEKFVKQISSKPNISGTIVRPGGTFS